MPPLLHRAAIMMRLEETARGAYVRLLRHRVAGIIATVRCCIRVSR